MAQHPQIDLQVAYCCLRGANSGYDPDFATAIQWDVPLLTGYDWVEIPNIGTGAESFLGLCNPALWRLIRRGSFDAVLCHTGYLNVSFWIGLLASKLTRTAFLFGTDATTLASRDSRWWKVAVKKILWPGLFRLADQVIVPSSAGVALMRTLGIPPEQITLTPFVVDNDWWTEKSKLVDRDAVRSDWGVTPGQQVILFCAKLQPWKRPADLLRAFSSLNLSTAVLVFAGVRFARNSKPKRQNSELLRVFAFLVCQSIPASRGLQVRSLDCIGCQCGEREAGEFMEFTLRCEERFRRRVYQKRALVLSVKRKLSARAHGRTIEMQQVLLLGLAHNICRF